MDQEARMIENGIDFEALLRCSAVPGLQNCAGPCTRAEAVPNGCMRHLCGRIGRIPAVLKTGIVRRCGRDINVVRLSQMTTI